MAERRRETGKREMRERERKRERNRLVCRTSAGLVSAAAGGQTGCPDSTEGRLLCLPRVARGSLERRALRRLTVVPRSGKERRTSERASEEKRTARVRRRESAASRRRAVTRARTRVSGVFTRDSADTRGTNVCVFPSSIRSVVFTFFFLSSPRIDLHECNQTSLADALGL